MEALLLWFIDNRAAIFMGVAGGAVAFLMSDKPVKERLKEFAIGVILATALSNITARFFDVGPEWIGGLGFIYGMGGITIARLIHTGIQIRGNKELDRITGGKKHDDASPNQ